MARVLVVQHTPSPAVHAMLEAVLNGARTPEVTGVDVVVRAALSASAFDVLQADAVIVGTPANIGYMSGGLKTFFDAIYYPCLEVTVGLPYGLFVHGNDDVTGAVRSVEKIAGGLRWTPVVQPVTVVGAPSRDDLDACWNLGAVVAATVAE